MSVIKRLIAFVFAAVLVASTGPAMLAQEATPEASTDASAYGEAIGPLECWSDEADFSVTGYAQFPGIPAMTIDPAKTYYATVETNRGTFVIELKSDIAPVTVNNFVCLASNHYYDGVIFHRVIRDFMIQAGDPTGTGRGGPGYQFNDELPGDGVDYQVGMVAMANAGPNTNGSQFFVNTANNSGTLPKDYTIFGTVVEGMDVVMRIAEVPVGTNAQGEQSVPNATMTILHITISEK